MKLKRRITAEEFNRIMEVKKILLYQKCALTGDYFLHTEFRCGNIIPVSETPLFHSTAYKGK